MIKRRRRSKSGSGLGVVKKRVDVDWLVKCRIDDEENRGARAIVTQGSVNIMGRSRDVKKMVSTVDYVLPNSRAVGGPGKYGADYTWFLGDRRLSESDAEALAHRIDDACPRRIK